MDGGPGNSQGEAAAAASLALVLTARDRRAATQRALLAHPGLPLVSLLLVSPGAIKDSVGRRRLLDMAEAALGHTLRAADMTVRFRSRLDAVTGPEALWAVQARPGALKRLAIQLEEAQPWGRLLDADVIVPGPFGEPTPLSRLGFGGQPRSCLVCTGTAKACIAARNHPPEEAALVVSGLIEKFTGSA